MFEMGADIVKIFPAGTLGPKYIKDIRPLLWREMAPPTTPWPCCSSWLLAA